MILVTMFLAMLFGKVDVGVGGDALVVSSHLDFLQVRVTPDGLRPAFCRHLCENNEGGSGLRLLLVEVHLMNLK